MRGVREESKRSLYLYINELCERACNTAVKQNT
jgi:hypothetical protein